MISKQIGKLLKVEERREGKEGKIKTKGQTIEVLRAKKENRTKKDYFAAKILGRFVKLGMGRLSKSLEH